MGLNIAGIVIDKNYNDQLASLQSIFGEELVFEKEVDFEEALESWKEETYCDIYFSKNGTLVILSMEMGGFDFYAENQTVFSFVLSESTMMFCVNYTKDGKLIRSVMEGEDLDINEGEPLDFEKTEEDKSELIYHLLEKTLGESFDDIELEAKCLRFSFKEAKDLGEYPNTENSIPAKTEEKPWWKFW